MSEFITKVVIAADNQTAPAVNAATKGIQNYAKAATAAQSQVRGASRQSRAALQQLGYQVQDISVQLQAGQSPFVVLAQQGSQVASIFGPGGAVIGALIAVGGAIAGSLLPSLFAGSKSLQDLEERAKELGKTLKEIAPLAAAEAEKEAAENTKKATKAYEDQLNVIKGLEELKARYQAFPGDKIGTTRKSTALVDLESKIYEARKAAELLSVDLLVKDPKIEAAIEAEKRSYETLADQLKELDALYQQHETPRERLIRSYKEADEVVRKYADAEELANRMRDAALEQYNASLPKKEKVVDLTDKEAQAYENLKRALDPAYGAYQNYYEAVTQINNSSDTQANKITLVAVAYAKLYESLGLVREAQKTVAKASKAEEWENVTSALEEYRKVADDTVSLLDNAGVGALRSMEDALSGLIAGTTSAKDAFRSMATSIVNDLIRMQIQKSITGPLAGLLGSALGNFGTAMTYGTNVGSEQTAMLAAQDFEGGGYTGSGVRSGGLDGKGGFMAMVHPNETVIDHTKGGGSGVVINQTIQVTTGVQQTVRAEIMGLMPQIANASKQAVLDARKRGGNFSGAF